MSYVPGDKSIDPETHFISGMKDFFRLDKVRFINLAGSVQYGILYSVAYLIIGLLIHKIFPPFTTNISLTSLSGWILLQCLVLILVTFYVKKFIEAIPGIISFFPKYFNIDMLRAKGFIPYGVDEYKGDMASSIVLIGTQFVLIDKIKYLVTELAKIYF
jgi:hypothetical protein